jgi:hypothetical protein
MVDLGNKFPFRDQELVHVPFAAAPDLLPEADDRVPELS